MSRRIRLRRYLVALLSRASPRSRSAGAVSFRSVVAGLRQRPRQLALLRVAADHQGATSASSRWPGPIRTATPAAAHRRARRGLWPRPQRIARRRRCQDRQGTLGPRKHERHDQPRFELLGERRRTRSAPDLRDEQPAAGGGREDGQVHHDVRHERRRRPARGHRRPRSGDASATSSRTRPAKSSRTSSSSVARPAKATCRRPATSARMTCSPASWCGRSTPCRGPASSATTPGRRTRGNTSAAPTPGAR